jgi:hypothetical protein
VVVSRGYLCNDSADLRDVTRICRQRRGTMLDDQDPQVIHTMEATLPPFQYKKKVRVCEDIYAGLYIYIAEEREDGPACHLISAFRGYLYCC